MPRVLEITFLNNERLSKENYPKVYSRRHPLDIDNINMIPTLEIPKSWYLSKN